MSSIQSVTGPLTPEELGITLAHEHLFANGRAYWSPPPEAVRRRQAEAPVEIGLIGAIRRDPLGYRDNLLLDDIELGVTELKEYAALGGSTLVDLTLDEIGRDAAALRTVSIESGVKIIAGCGRYVRLSHFPDVARLSVEELAAEMVADLETGIGDTGIRAGVIGEIGTSVPLDPDEERVLRAAGRAHKQTGASIAIHLSPPPSGAWFNAHEVLDVLEAEDVDLRCVLLSHLDNVLGPGDELTKAVEYHEELARRGCFLGYDSCGKEHYVQAGSTANYGNLWCPSDQIRAKAISLLADEGLLDQVIVSQDICFKIELRRYGGFGYGHVLRTFSQNLADYGVDREGFKQLVIDNPRSFLCR